MISNIPNMVETVKIDRAKIPGEVISVVRRLQEAGYEAYLVGGCVRDLVMDAEPGDYDVATNARPDEVVRLFPRTAPTGMKHGTVSVLGERGRYEVTTYRCDGKYGDARHPDEVAFTGNIKEDLARRDFTIGAMAYDPINEVFLDIFGGVQDFGDRVIRAVGDPAERFYEDGLRPLRAIRFAARFDFAVDPATFAAIPAVLDRVRLVSAERVRDEIMKMLEQAPNPSYGFELMRESGLMELFLPELLDGYGVEQNKFHAYTVYLHNVYTCDNAPTEKPLIRLAALLHDVAKPQTRRERNGKVTFYNHQVIGSRVAKKIMERLRFSKRDRDYVGHLVYHHMFGYTDEWTDSAVRRFIRKVGRAFVEDLFELRIADTIGSGRPRAFPVYLEKLKRRIDKELASQDAFNVKDLVVGGEEVMERLGIAPGPEVGNALKFLLERVLDEPALNRREKLLELLDEYKVLTA
jgi:tRNA nucleotidyltransferase (CCA-adding enzyme)